MSQSDFSFVHFTDTHIMAGRPPEPPWGDTAASLRRVVDAVNALAPAPAFVVVGGDLVSPDLIDRTRTLTAEEYEPSYRLLRELLAPLRCPVHLLLGNHDHRHAFHRVMGSRVASLDEPHRYAFDHEGYHFVALDSHEPGQTAGFVDAGQLAWLEADLDTNRGRPTVVFVHHHLWPLGLAWLDAMPLRNGEELTRLLAPRRDVRWVVCGHVHQDHHAQRDGLTMVTTPATSVQISKLAQTRNHRGGVPALRLVRVTGGELASRILQLQGDGLDSV